MKRMAAALALCLLVPAVAGAQIAVTGETIGDGANQIVRYTAEAVQTDEALDEDAQLAQDMKLMMISGAIDMRLAQARAQQIYDSARSGGGVDIHQTPSAYADEQVISLALVWQGTQPDGSTASRPYTLMIDPATGLEIADLRALFADPEGAIAAMEAIVQRDLLDDMNAYIEVADLLPLPTDRFSADETGLTVYYGDDRYRTFEGRSGHVVFYWHELAAFIGTQSPVYALSGAAQADLAGKYGLDAPKANGYFGAHRLLGLYEPLGKAMGAYDITDEPDYTASSVLYTFSEPELRGMAVEIDKYAETDEADTPISAVRHSRVRWQGMTTGVSTREEIIALLGAPDDTRLYDEDAAGDMLLEPGESLIYALEDAADPMVAELHLDVGGVLSCVILRDAMPEMLY